MTYATPPRGTGRFHLAMPVHDLKAARAFYGEVLGCPEGRSAPGWVDFDFFGHQFVAHLSGQMSEDAVRNPVDGAQVPVPHFGVIIDPGDFAQLTARLERHDVDYVIEPVTRFAGTPGEQSTCFVRDPSGNVLEFKAFATDAQVFAKFESAEV